MVASLTLYQYDALERLRDDAWHRPHARASDEHLLVGSEQWVDRQEARAKAAGRRYSAAAVLKRVFRFLLEYEPEAVSGHGETAYGRAIHHAYVNLLECTIAANKLTEHQQRAWMLYVDDFSYREIAERMDVRQETARKLVSLAVISLRDAIWDRVDNTLSTM